MFHGVFKYHFGLTTTKMMKRGKDCLEAFQIRWNHRGIC
ncbi:hypothetical protein ACPOL_5522 [Acidisarcina polymorpha]|uniref:Uncharacterized protein n=1 Tax=Acidisarcina polymorpha TaxID=2211140 RepID=A0A2Z5G728_9BACT|nr:hypothetical protein ACPOL_5522 [Acidisarcina polymorpha]